LHPLTQRNFLASRVIKHLRIQHGMKMAKVEIK
jgi:hypothetical protein